MSAAPQHIGLFFGSFNPVHIGHLIIANYLVEASDMTKVWFVVSPQNPFKQSSSLLNEYDRLHLVRLAIGDNPSLHVTNIEFELPKPSYTIDTLTHLGDRFPGHSFSLIMGSDNLHSFRKWKNHERILAAHHIYVYKRSGSEKSELAEHPNVHVLDVPLLDISATFIRKAIAEGRSMQYFLPDAVWEYVREMGYYKS